MMQRLTSSALIFSLLPFLQSVDKLLMNQPAIDALKAGEDPRAVTRRGAEDLERFKRDRAAALLYK